MKKILLPEKITDAGLDLLKAKAQIVISKSIAEEAILDEIHDTFGIVLRSAAKITRRILENAPNLKVISRTGAGYDNVDVQAATDHGVMVCNLPGINTVSVAEHTIAMIFSLMKSLPTMDSYVRNGEWKRRSQYISMEVEGKVLGIVGLGKIGHEVMKKAKALGLNIIIYDPYMKGKVDAFFIDSLDELFIKADIITIHVPNLPETAGMIDDRLLGLMKPTAYIINTSRGEVVNEDALINVLKSKKIAGAGLDVFINEPISMKNPLIGMDNVLLSPHTAALTKECGLKMTIEAVKQVIDVIEGKVPQYIVNRSDLNL